MFVGVFYIYFSCKRGNRGEKEIKTCLNRSKFYHLKKNYCYVDIFSSRLSKIRIWVGCVWGFF